MIIESSDPGTKNFAHAIAKAEDRGGKLQVTLLWLGMLESPLKSIQGDIRPAVKSFLGELEGRRKSLKVVPDVIVQERFQARGLGGSTGEVISAMSGARAKECIDRWPKAEFLNITASQWKNEANKYFDLKAWYKLHCSERVTSNLPRPHELDAALICCYAAAKFLGLIPFANMRTRKEQLGFLKQVKEMVKDHPRSDAQRRKKSKSKRAR